ncbi:MAG: VWA domain-containing protein, partial [Gammaproteobacteria bacterium]|nr:VWA domain-containing protein [Gammaproteobacteria bacterium]
MEQLLMDFFTLLNLLVTGELAWREQAWLWAMALPLLLWLLKKRGKSKQQQAYADPHLWAWVSADAVSSKHLTAPEFSKKVPLEKGYKGLVLQRLQRTWLGAKGRSKQLLSAVVIGLTSPSKWLTIGWLCLVVALAGPRSMVASGDIQSREGVDILVSMDLSNSMTAEDVYPNRFLFAKSLLESMMTGLEAGDRLALQGFAGHAHMVSPLSYDRSLFKHSLNLLEPNLLPLQGTWLDLAVIEGITHLSQTAGSAKVMVMFTNGAPEFWKPVDVPEAIQNSPFYQARQLSDTGVKIIVVGVGQRSATSLKDSSHKSGKL